MTDFVPSGSSPIAVTATGTTGAFSTTMGTNANLGRTIYITGFSYQSSGATAGTTVTISVQYAPVNNAAAVTLGTWSYIVGTGTTAQPPLTVNLIPAMASQAPITGVTNTTTTTPTGSIIINAGAAGAGATGACLNAWGFMQ